jgi:hypothetical protein
MIGTIGSLVKETGNRWPLAMALHAISALSTSMLFGALLALIGHFWALGTCGAAGCVVSQDVGRSAALVIGGIAVSYAASDLGFFRLPRPVLMYAVPVTWWRRWQPYGAALLYGAALGVGVTTRIRFGSFYVICALCVASGNVTYGASLLGTFGVIRALALIPASQMVHRTGAGTACSLDESYDRMRDLHLRLAPVHVILAGLLVAFGTTLLIG